MTVLVRSMLLRGFDRDMVDKIQTHMLALGRPWHWLSPSLSLSLISPSPPLPPFHIICLHHHHNIGTKILVGRLPARIEKVTEGDVSKLRVVYDNGHEELYDTVIAAVGRYV